MPAKLVGEIRHIGFSVGVAFVVTVEWQMKSVLLGCCAGFPDMELTVAFCQALGNAYLDLPGTDKPLQAMHRGFLAWLNRAGVALADISGG